LIAALLEDLGGPAQDFATFFRQNPAPDLEAALSRRQRAIKIFFRGMGQLAENFTCSRVNDLFALA
jgi:hypothetical protein